MPKPIILVGAGENTQVIETALRESYTVAGYLDDHKTGPAILGSISDAAQYISTHAFFVCIGDNQHRQSVLTQLQQLHADLINAIHPTALIETGVTLGLNVFVGAKSIINVGTVVGDGTFVNTSCIVEHDNRLGACVHLAPGVITGGGVTIADGCFIGLGARINDHLNIGNQTVVGSGAVVIDDLPAQVTAVGIPAKILSRL